MIIYLDESKRLGKWLIVVGWFVSSHNTSYIEKFMENKKQDFWIPEDIELKSIDKYGRIFIEKISTDQDFDDLDLYSFGFCFDNYFFDSEEAYTNLVLKVLTEIYSICPYKKTKTVITHDDINIKSHKLITKKVESYLKQNFDVKAKFWLYNSKKFLSLQLADLLVSKYKEYYFFDDVVELDTLIVGKDLEQQKI